MVTLLGSIFWKATSLFPMQSQMKAQHHFQNILTALKVRILNVTYVEDFYKILFYCLLSD